MDWIKKSLIQMRSKIEDTLTDGIREAEKSSPIKSDQHSFLTGWYGQSLKLTAEDIDKLIQQIDDYMKTGILEA